MTLEDAGEDQIAHRERRIERLDRATAGVAQRLVAGPADPALPFASPCVGSEAFRAPRRRPRTARIQIGRNAGALITAPESSWLQSIRMVQRKRPRPTAKVNFMIISSRPAEPHPQPLHAHASAPPLGRVRTELIPPERASAMTSAMALWLRGAMM
jgi:hypothetical protein